MLKPKTQVKGPQTAVFVSKAGIIVKVPLAPVNIPPVTQLYFGKVVVSLVQDPVPTALSVYPVGHAVQVDTVLKLHVLQVKWQRVHVEPAL